MRDLQSEIEKIHRENVRDKLLGTALDVIVKPTRHMNKAEYCVRRLNSHVLIIDELNRNIVMDADIGALSDLYHRGRENVDSLVYCVRLIAEGIYIVSITGKDFSVEDIHKASLYWEGFANEQIIEENNNQQHDRDRVFIRGWYSHKHKQVSLHNRMFICIDGQSKRIAQFMIRGHMLILDICVGTKERPGLRRRCIDVRNRRLIAESIWVAADFEGTRKIPHILCTKDYLLTEVECIRPVQSTYGPQGHRYGASDEILLISCYATLYDYECHQIRRTACTLQGKVLEFIVFDGIGDDNSSVEIEFPG
jgi:hypothetical protein